VRTVLLQPHYPTFASDHTQTNIGNLWEKCVGKDATGDDTRLIQFPKQSMNSACDALSSNLEADGVVAWIEADVKTLVMQHHS
jgi:hypothetical protein